MKDAKPAPGMHRSPLGLRFNAGKARPGLSSPWAMEGLAKVSEYGSRKYAPWNWAKGLSWGETIDCLERHLIAFKKGEENDAESGLPHIDHLLWNAMALSHFQKLGHGVDDRWKGVAKTITLALKEPRDATEYTVLKVKAAKPLNELHGAWCPLGGCTGCATKGKIAPHVPIRLGAAAAKYKKRTRSPRLRAQKSLTKVRRKVADKRSWRAKRAH